MYIYIYVFACLYVYNIIYLVFFYIYAYMFRGGMIQSKLYYPSEWPTNTLNSTFLSAIHELPSPLMQ